MNAQVATKLSRRQLEIVNHLRDGKSSRAIGELLSIDSRTVDAHIAGICNKLGVRTRVEIVVALFGSAASSRPDPNPGPEPRPNRSDRTNLQAPLSRLIGRQEEIREIGDLIVENRLVTVTGAGGSGKSRIAIAVAEALLETGTLGVWLIELAPLTDGAAAAVARALHVQTSAQAPLIETLCAAMRERELILVLDNCEHMIAEVAQLVEALLRQCPGLKMLATSREPLKIEGERTYRVPPLSLPPQRMPRSPAALLEFAAIRLFVDRARAANQAFEWCAATAPYVETICRQLDGLPLAIELAAGRADSLDVMTITKLLGRRFQLLTGGRRNALPRHQTMRATMEWSYDLLNAAERMLLQRTAVFANGWTADAAAMVCAFGDLESVDILELLSSLVAKSLVVMDLVSHQARYRLLESTRAFAREKLRETSDEGVLCQRLGYWSAEFADRARGELYAMPRKTWIPKIELELDNIRAALDWIFESSGDPCFAAEILLMLQSFWVDTGQFLEGVQWLNRYEKRIDINAMTAEAGVYWLAKSLISSGAPCVAAARAAIARFASAGKTDRLARAYMRLGVGNHQMGAAAEAEQSIDKAIDCYRELNLSRTFFYSTCLSWKALTLLARGRRAEARPLFLSCVTLNESLGDFERAGMEQLNLAELEFGDGNVAAALKMVEASLAAFDSHNERITVVANLNAAAYRLVLGDFEESRRNATEALCAADRMKFSIWRTLAIQHLATTIVLLENDADTAARLLGYVEACLERDGVTREPTDRVTFEMLERACRERLDSHAFSTLRALGRRLSDSDAMDLALRWSLREVSDW